jgi:hypothetical protein
MPFSKYLAEVLPAVVRGLADETEIVREAALKAGQAIVSTYAQAATDLLIPLLENGALVSKKFCVLILFRTFCRKLAYPSIFNRTSWRIPSPSCRPTPTRRRRNARTYRYHRRNPWIWNSIGSLPHPSGPKHSRFERRFDDLEISRFKHSQNFEGHFTNFDGHHRPSFGLRKRRQKKSGDLDLGGHRKKIG